MSSSAALIYLDELLIIDSNTRNDQEIYLQNKGNILENDLIQKPSITDLVCD
jgi:hypothetical protein